METSGWLQGNLANTSASRQGDLCGPLSAQTVCKPLQADVGLQGHGDKHDLTHPGQEQLCTLYKTLAAREKERERERALWTFHPWNVQHLMGDT